MTTDDRKRDLIEKAAKAIYDTQWTDPDWSSAPEGTRECYRGDVRSALAVFEAAQKPADDEREALYREATSRAETAYPALNDDDELLSYPRAALRQHKRGAYITGFTDGAALRPVSPEPQTEPTDALRAYLVRKGLNPDRMGNWDDSSGIGLARDAFLAGWSACRDSEM